jgi:hypothetical protein
MSAYIKAFHAHVQEVDWVKGAGGGQKPVTQLNL